MQWLKKIFENDLKSKIFLESFFRSIGISRIKRGGHTIRRSLFMVTNVSDSSFSQAGTLQKYHFQVVNLVKMIQMYENSIMFELQTTLKNFLHIFNVHYGYLKVTLDIRLSKVIVRIKKKRPNGDIQSHSLSETHMHLVTQ